MRGEGGEGREGGREGDVYIILNTRRSNSS